MISEDFTDFFNNSRGSGTERDEIYTPGNYGRVLSYRILISTHRVCDVRKVSQISYGRKLE